jgi:hypothetical protein
LWKFVKLFEFQGATISKLPLQGAFMATMKVGTRLSLGFGLVLVLLLLVSLLGVFNMSTIHAQLERIVNENTLKTQLVTDMSESVHIVARDAQRGAAQR